MQIDYGLLFALSAVAREGSFDAAAKSLGLTQSAISQRIKQLEKNLGTVLILRGRPCLPTPTGLKLIEHLEKVALLQVELQEQLGEFGAHSQKYVSTIRVSVNNDSLATWFPKVIKRERNF